jgi:glycosyltransferase involved in cell wall biosynthesis
MVLTPIHKPKLSVIIPCFNEINTIDTIIDRVVHAKPSHKEIILVDDGSTDGSQERLKVLKPKIDKLILRKVNEGKGAALRDGINAAEGSIIIFQDADLEYDPAEYEIIISPIVSGFADVVYGSRFSGGNVHRVMFFWHRIANGILTLISNMFTNLNLTDMETCFKAFRAEVLKDIHLVENRFGVEPEITAKISKRNLRIYEVGISYQGRTYEEGKKIGLKDAFRALYCILKYKFSQ